jgi:hypothetical protein
VLVFNVVECHKMTDACAVVIVDIIAKMSAEEAKVSAAKSRGDNDSNDSDSDS